MQTFSIKYLEAKSKNTSKKIILYDQVSLVPERERWFNICMLINAIHNINKLRDKTRMIISDAEKTFDKSNMLS